LYEHVLTFIPIAEFRGPGVHHRYDENSDDYDMDMDQRTRFGGFGNAGGSGSRIILLSDGPEATGENGDADMFDHADEDRDLDAQVSKVEDSDSEDDGARNQREGTPAPPSSQPTVSTATGMSAPSKTYVGIEC
jgi:protein phosphatase PTC2/3